MSTEDTISKDIPTATVVVQMGQETTQSSIRDTEITTKQIPDQSSVRSTRSDKIEQIQTAAGETSSEAFGEADRESTEPVTIVSIETSTHLLSQPRSHSIIDCH